MQWLCNFSARRAAGGSQHHTTLLTLLSRYTIQCRAFDGEPQLKPFSGGIMLHRIEHASLSGWRCQVESFPERRRVCPVIPVILLFRGRDVTDGFDTSTRGTVNSFFLVLRPSVFRSFSAPPVPASVLCSPPTRQISIVAPQCVSVPCRRCVAYSRGLSLGTWNLVNQAPNKCHPFTLQYTTVLVQSIGRPESQTKQVHIYLFPGVIHMRRQRWMIHSFLTFLPESGVMFHFNAPWRPDDEHRRRRIMHFWGGSEVEKL